MPLPYILGHTPDTRAPASICAKGPTTRTWSDAAGVVGRHHQSWGNYPLGLRGTLEHPPAEGLPHLLSRRRGW